MFSTRLAIIPLSAAEVERSYNVMTRICAGIRQSLATENFSSCTFICKFHELHDEDYRQIFQMVNG